MNVAFKRQLFEAKRTIWSELSQSIMYDSNFCTVCWFFTLPSVLPLLHLHALRYLTLISSFQDNNVLVTIFRYLQTHSDNFRL